MDYYSGFIYLHNQVSLRAGETLQGKHAFERFSLAHGVRLKAFRADNHPYRADEFVKDLELQGQSITYSGVGAHHQNGVSERNLATVSLWARALLMTQLLHWPDQFDPSLWPFAMEQAVHIWNHLPRSRSGHSPIELFTGISQPVDDTLLRARVWGCLVYVLDPKLQDGKRLPKWHRRSRCGMHLGVSPSHSDTVGRILNLRTGAISCQYHMVFDKQFSTVFGQVTDDVIDPQLWDTLLKRGSEENYLDKHDSKDPHVIDPARDLFDSFVDASSSSTSVPEGVASDSDSESDYSDSDTDSDDDETSVESLKHRTTRSVAKYDVLNAMMMHFMQRPVYTHPQLCSRPSQNVTLHSVRKHTWQAATFTARSRRCPYKIKPFMDSIGHHQCYCRLPTSTTPSELFSTF